MQITFSYPSSPGQLAIENASFFFPAGETTFVIGRSGSGKSTLGNLLIKFYQPSLGSVLVDGRSIHTLDLDWLRNNISLVQQESVLFNETVFRNIAFGRRQHTLVSKDDVKMACQTAMLQQTIDDLPEGLDTMVGLGGNSLSGGQKQRVAVARARLHDAPILILDESTSALDPVSRSLVMEAIRRWRRGKTTIIITHDVSEVLEKDYVYVLDRGRVVQEGYRHQLLQDHAGLFTSLVSLKDEDEKDDVSSKAAPLSPEPRKPIVESSITEISEDAWPQTHHRTGLELFSQVLGLNDSIPPRGHSNYQRISRGFGMGSVYANTFHANNVTGDTRSLSFSRPFPIPTRPLPAIPSPREFRRFYHSDHSPSNDELEVLQRGKSTKISRSQVTGSQHPRRIYSNDHVNPKGNIVSYLPPRWISQQAQKEAQNLPESRPNEGAMLSQILGTVWPNLLKEDRTTLILGFINTFISAAATPAFSYVLARLLGTFSLSSDQTSSAEIWALAILAIAVTDGISSYYMHYFLEFCGQTWVDRLRVEALKRILAQPKAWFDKPKNNPGRLSECLDRNAEEMRNLVGRFAGYVFLAGSMMSIAIVWAFIVCWKLTLIGLAGGPCMYAFTRAFEAVSVRWEKRLNEMADGTASVFTETFSNIKVVRALTLENYLKEKHSRATMKAYNVGMSRAAYTGLFFGMSDSTSSLVTALILYYGAVVAASGAWSIDSILQVITLLLFSSGNANSAIALIPQISSSRTTATQMLHLSNLPPTASHESRESAIYLRTPLPIRLNSLSFTYPSRPSVPVLHNVSMTFLPGSCTAIVGPSGSGKSTLVSLLLGLYPPTEPLHCPSPSLTFGPAPGTSIFATSIAHLRSSIILVTQSPVIFPTTVAENVAYGLPAHSPLRSDFNIQTAAKEAGIHDRIMRMEKGYGTIIGDGGVGLSGGERRRVGLARGLARRAKCLVLDEPSSGLDGESAAIIRHTIARLVRRDKSPAAGEPSEMPHESGAGSSSQNRSDGRYERGSASPDGSSDTAVILVTHSIEMMRVATNIFVLDQGRVVQEGSFDELARKRGPFQRLIWAGRGRGRGGE